MKLAACPQRVTRFLCVLLLFLLAPAISSAQSKPEEVVFPSAGRELRGFLWKPDGPGPPANGPPTWGNGLFMGFSRFWKDSAGCATDTTTIYRKLSLRKVEFRASAFCGGLRALAEG